MPMRDPVAQSGGGFTPPSEIQNGAMFIGTLSQVECKPYAGPPHYNEDGTQKQETSIVWHFTLRDHSTLQMVIGNDGEPYDQFRYTSDATTRSSFGRVVIEALAGREVTDAEIAQLLAADPDHMPTKLVGKSALLVMGPYTDSRGQQRIGIAQNLPLSQKDRARLEAHLKQEYATPAAAQPVAQPRMGPPPAQQFDQSGREVPVAATADGSAELPW